MPKLVFNIRAASSSDVTALSRHCKDRTPDGWSSIDHARTALNRQLHGDGETVSDSLRAWYERTGAKKPTKQAEAPYLTIVLGASAEFFQQSPQAVEQFQAAAMEWLRNEFGDDLVFADLHLDETTPHLHAVVAPTYEKAARKPGRQKRDESPEEFEARKAVAAAAPGVRTVGRSSSKWAAADSFDTLRRSATKALDHLGVEYGEKRRGGPKGRSTREWVKEGLSRARDLFRRGRAAWGQLEERQAELETREKALEQLEARTAKVAKAADAKLAAAQQIAGAAMQEQIRARGLHDRLKTTLWELRRALPVESLKPGTREKVSGALTTFESELREVDQELKASVSTVRDAVDRGPRPR